MARGFYVRNEKGTPFADLIANGFKTVETRNRRTLDALTVDYYRSGYTYAEPVYIIRSEHGKRSMVIGRCYIMPAYWCPNDRLYDADVVKKTYLTPDSMYAAKRDGKWLYDIVDAEPFPCDVPVPSDSVRHGRTWIEFDAAVMPF